jgi:RNA polymerase sigma-70 factor, ECF subfamily
MTTLSPERWLADHGDALFRYAYLKLRDTQVAEDLVQETLLAAWRGRARFSGNSSERTWLISILKHKVADHWRRETREPRVDESLADDSAEKDELLARIFDARANDHWRSDPSPWRDPDRALESQDFWRIFADCIAALPPAQAQAFGLTEIDGLIGEETCKVMEIASTNLWVMLHRARLRLRECLEKRWFGESQEG